MSVTIQNQNRRELIQFAVKKIFGLTIRSPCKETLVNTKEGYRFLSWKYFSKRERAIFLKKFRG